MSYNVGTVISFKKTSATDLWQPSTEVPVGTRVRFLNWLLPVASLDLAIA